MPSYEIQLPTGEKYQVDSDKELSNEEAWRYAMAQHNASGASAPTPPSRGMSPFAAVMENPSMIHDLAAKVPYVGGVLAAPIPTTRGGWGATAGALVAAPFTGGMSIPAAAATTGAAAGLGGAGAELAGGATPGEAALTGLGEGAATAAGYAGSAWLSKQAKAWFSPIMRWIGPKLDNIFPGIGDIVDKETGDVAKKGSTTWLQQLIRGKEGLKKVGERYGEMLDQVGAKSKGAIVQDPELSDIIQNFRKYIKVKLPVSATAAEGQPAHLAIGSMDVPTAIQVSKDLSRAARNISDKSLDADALNAAAAKLREEILPKYVPQEAMRLYTQANQMYGSAYHATQILNHPSVFTAKAGGVKIDETHLAQRFNDAQAVVNNFRLSQLQKAALRGGPPGSGATWWGTSGSAYPGAPGLVPAHLRFHGKLGFTNYPGTPIPGVGPIGGIAGQRLFGDLLTDQGQ